MRSITIGVFAVAAFLAGCTEDSPPRPVEPPKVVRGPSLSSGFIASQTFGRARIAVGMPRKEVLRQIELSRSQHQPLQDEQSTELYIARPSEETVDSDQWLLTCPSRNSHVLGGGSGIILSLKFTDDKVESIRRLPWLAG